MESAFGFAGFGGIEVERRAEKRRYIIMRLLYFLGGITGGLFTVLRLPKLPESINDLWSSNDPQRFAATSFVCLTLLTGILTYVCVKKTFPPPRTK